MKMFFKHITKNKPGRVAKTLCGAVVAFLPLLITSCMDDLIYDKDTTQDSSQEEVNEINIPGYLTVSLSAADLQNTRSQESSDGNSFNDGVSGEFAFSTGSHHYIVLYKKSYANGEAHNSIGVLPLSLKETYDPTVSDDDRAGNPIKYGNITLKAKTLVRGSQTSPTVETVEDMQALLSESEAFVLVNFDKSQIFIPSSNESSSYPDYPTQLTKNFIEGNTTGNILASLTKEQIKLLAINDYKIRVRNDNKTIADANYKGETTDYFTMTNSVYLDGSNNYVWSLSNTVNKDNVFYSEDQAFESPAITAQLERLAVKYTVDLSPLNLDANNEFVLEHVQVYKSLDINSDAYDIASVDGTLKVKVLGYAMNALEPSTIGFKNIKNSQYYDAYSWNDYQNNQRSYWTEDSHYVINSNTVAGYPHQYRQALETDTVRSFHYDKYHNGYDSNSDMVINDKNDNFFLNYFSFNNLKGKYDANTDKVFYTLENTYDNSIAKTNNIWNQRLWKPAYLSAATNLIVLCKLEVDPTSISDNEVASRYQGENLTLYYGQNSIFYASQDRILYAKLALFNKVILPGGTSDIRILNSDWLTHTPNADFHTGDQSAQDMLNIKGWYPESLLWIRDDGVEPTGDNSYYEDVSKFRLAEMPDPMNPSDNFKTDLTLIPAEVSGGDGKMLIAPSDKSAFFFLAPPKLDADGKIESIDNEIYTFNEIGTDGLPVEVRTNKIVYMNYNNLVSLFHKLIGAIEVFTNGYCYYSAPVTHNVNSLTNTSWFKVGDIGVVRNNWYKIKIDGIKDIGRPVADPDQPIIPWLEAHREYLNLTVNILPWHTITQTDIKEK